MDHRPGDDDPAYRDRDDSRYHSHPHIDIDYERQRAAATRDYTTPAVVTLILYFVCWLPGVIANVIYYLQAQRDEALTGRAPQGKGCLLSLLIAVNGLVILAVLAYCTIFVMGAALSA